MPAIEQKTRTLIPRGTEQTLVVETLQDMTIALEEGATLNFVLFGTKGWEETAHVRFELLGSNCELNFLGFIIGREKAKFPFETISHHQVPQTKAHYNVKAALYDSALVDYQGTLIIDKPAQLADTYLSHHTLLMSDKARARTIPALEIEADDVVAGHAATIGKVDKELMFYLKSRGIDPKAAERLLITGFFESHLEMIPDEQIREELRTKIIDALPFSHES